MSINTKLPLMTCYYIQKLVRQQDQHLKSVLATGAGCNAKQETDINKVLDSLYLETDEIAAQVKKLEVLVRWHQTLSQDLETNQKQLTEVEVQIFWIIGLKKSPPPSQQTLTNAITNSGSDKLTILFG